MVAARAATTQAMSTVEAMTARSERIVSPLIEIHAPRLSGRDRAFPGDICASVGGSRSGGHSRHHLCCQSQRPLGPVPLESGNLMLGSGIVDVPRRRPAP